VEEEEKLKISSRESRFERWWMVVVGGGLSQESSLSLPLVSWVVFETGAVYAADALTNLIHGGVSALSMVRQAR
jgi:hypothetical protein